MRKVIVLGASPNPNRYAYKATEKLLDAGFEVVPIGIREGSIKGVEIITEKVKYGDVDSITLYLSPKHQEEWKQYIIDLNPKRVIFNPGTENAAFAKELEKSGIVWEEACTLVLLSLDRF